MVIPSDPFIYNLGLPLFLAGAAFVAMSKTLIYQDNSDKKFEERLAGMENKIEKRLDGIEKKIDDSAKK